MEVLDAYQVAGFLDFILANFAAVPIGFLLAMVLGFAAFGIFGLLRLFRRLLSR